MRVLTKTAIAGGRGRSPPRRRRRLQQRQLEGERAGAALTAAATPTAVTPGPTINVAGHGEVEGTPDVMTVTMGVQTIDPSAQAALQHNNDRGDRARSTSLKAQGVAAKDIQTVDLNVSPNFDKNFHVTGYSASNTVTAKLRDLSKAGKVIDAAALTAGRGHPLPGRVVLDRQHERARREGARRRDQGRARAGQAARGRGRREARRDPHHRRHRHHAPAAAVLRAARRAQAGRTPRVPIEPGSQQLSVDVTVVFDIAG